jgi:outer membrane protein assembly factor BamE
MSFKNKYLTFSLALATLAGLVGCQMQVPMLPGIGPHKIDIQQGNAVTQEMVAKLQPGMTRNQVRFVLGTPLLVDPFRTDRWDYFYSYMKGGELIEKRRMAVFFKDDKLVRIDGDVIPAKPPGEKPVAEKPPASKTAADKPTLDAKPAAAVGTAAGAAAAAKPDAKPDTKPAAAAMKPEEKPAAAAKPEVKPAPTAAAPAVAPPSATALPPATLTTGDGAPVGSGVSTAEAKPAAKPEPKLEQKAAAPKPDAKSDEKPKEERGFFGRMLESIGF